MRPASIRHTRHGASFPQPTHQPAGGDCTEKVSSQASTATGRQAKPCGAGERNVHGSGYTAEFRGFSDEAYSSVRGVRMAPPPVGQACAQVAKWIARRRPRDRPTIFSGGGDT